MKRIFSLIVISALTASPASASLTDGLVAHYPFDGSFVDLSGNANHLSATTGVSFMQGVAGSAIHLNGSGYVRAGNSNVGNLGANGTLTFWFQPVASNFVVGSRVFEKDDRAYWWFALDSRGLAVRVHGENSYQGPGWDLIGGTPNSLAGVWSAVALRKVGARFDLFLNGVQVDTVNTTIATIITTAPLNFGNSYYWGTGYYTGGVDDARVYSRALSDSEIGQLAAIPESSTFALFVAGIALLLALTRDGVKRHATRAIAVR